MMIDKIAYIESTEFCPYHNLAVEEYLLLKCQEQECILYLWQNQHTIVIGRNQNAWKECLVSRLEEEGGQLARRLSGGGAVYHDLGNLNFTFLVRKENYNLEKQLQVIIEAVRKLGIKAEKSGRNDILADGKKFSGNAFYEQKQFCYHHGTLMVDVNIGELSKYLTVSKDKLKSKGVDSVKSRVANLKEFIPELTVSRLKAVLRDAFEEVYGYEAAILKEADLDQKLVRESTDKFGSKEWKYGKVLPFQFELSQRFVWGAVTLQLQVEKGYLKQIGVYSDSMKPDIILRIPQYLKGTVYDKTALVSKFRQVEAADEQEKHIIDDIAAWFETVDL